MRWWLRPDQPPRRTYAFRLADRILFADAPIAALAPFAMAESVHADPIPPLPAAASGEFACRSTGWICDAWREVRVWRHAQGLSLHIAGLGEFAVAADGGDILAFNADPVPDGTLVETLLGPPLVLALALQGVWCLHSCAVTLNGRVVAFAGESGSGKSTLAAHLDSAREIGWRRLTDDMLPVSLAPGGLLALPHFPQLKLTDVEQYPVNAPARLPLAALYVIGPQTGQDSISLRRMDPRQAMQALIRHTVAARLFDRPLLAAHLDFCAEAAARVPVWRLAYPHRREVLPQVRDVIHRSMPESSGGAGRREIPENAGR